MILKTKVKANSVTHLTDARYFAAWHVDWLGFNLQQGHENFVNPATLLALREWIDGPQVTGEFGPEDPADIARLADELQLDCIQLGPFSDQTTLEQLHGLRPLLKEIVVNTDSEADEIEATLAAQSGYVEAFLLNCSRGGISWTDLQAGRPFSVDRLRSWCDRFPLLLDIPFEEVSPNALLDQLDLHGFAVSGGEEEEVGVKSFDELDTFFEALEE